MSLEEKDREFSWNLCDADGKQENYPLIKPIESLDSFLYSKFSLY